MTEESALASPRCGTPGGPDPLTTLALIGRLP